MTASSSSARKKIHILGGGPAGLSAAFHLTSQEGWQDRYDLTVYQLGWRLGGKGASGRNRDACQRIEEHGIHLFGNMYSNSLHMMAATYDEVKWRPGEKITDMDKAFLPSDYQMITDFHDGSWHQYGSGLPHNEEIPWEGGVFADPGDIIEGMIEAMISIVTGGKNLAKIELPEEAHKHGFLGGLIEKATSLVKNLAHDLEHGLEGSLEHALEHALSHALAHARKQSGPLSHEDHKKLLDFFDRTLITVARKIEEAAGLVAKHDDKWRGIYIQLDLLVTCIRGFIEDDLLNRGIDSIDHLNYRDWLEEKGASDLTLNSAAPQGIPNTCMQYPGGDSTVLPQMSAAAFMTFVLRQVVARGQGAYFFAVSTGETVILPVYRALVQRGVEFRFFHKVTNLLPGKDAQGADAVGGIEFEIQAHVKGSRDYEPTCTLSSGEEVWPSQPLYDQLEEGEELEELAKRGYNLESWWTPWKGEKQPLDLDPETDIVVVAMPIDCHKHVCTQVTDLPAAEKWREMVENVGTAPTQQLQIWLDKTTEELGWDPLEGTNRHLGPSYANPLNAWGDFTDAIQWEQWPEDNKPKSCIYFCGPLQDPVTIPDFSDHDYPKRMKERVLWEAAQHLRGLAGLMPRAWSNPAMTRGLDFEHLVCHDPDKAGHGVNRLRQQFWKANIDPNERYTLSTPGSLRYRLHAWESGISNAVLCGDWCYTGFNIGSFEGSVMAGMLASHAITGTPTTKEILGYDFLHPNAQSVPKPLLG